MNVDRLLSVALTVSALAIAVTLVRREVAGGREAARSPNVGPPVYHDEWRGVLAAGTTIGDTAAAIQVVEFADFECPFCKRFHESLRLVRSKVGEPIAVTFVHFPLTMHRFALPAARAADCALEYGRFDAVADLLFAKQDSLGLKTWQSFATEAGIADTNEFAGCATAAGQRKNIEAGLAAGAEFNVRSTPTILLNGWLYSVPPTAAVLEADIKAILQGRQPGGGAEP